MEISDMTNDELTKQARILEGERRRRFYSDHPERQLSNRLRTARNLLQRNGFLVSVNPDLTEVDRQRAIDLMKGGDHLDLV